MRHLANSWAVLLTGAEVPAQAQVLPHLFSQAVARAQSVAPRAHICTVITSQHKKRWTPALSTLPSANVFLQPEDKGTAFSVLLALLRLHRLDPAALVTLLPTHHSFTDEVAITRALRTARNLTGLDVDAVYVLGTTADRPDVELGYILPSGGRKEIARTVVGFKEKPSSSQARELISLGALWNLCIVVGRVTALIELFRERYSEEIVRLCAALDAESSGERGILEVAYARQTYSDFAADVLEIQAARLQVVQVNNCHFVGLPRRPSGDSTPPVLLPYDVGVASCC